jgi:hypothetical protein
VAATRARLKKKRQRDAQLAADVRNLTRPPRASVMRLQAVVVVVVVVLYHIQPRIGKKEKV